MTQPEPVPGAPTEPTTETPAEPSTDPGQDPNAPVDIDSLPANVQQLIKKARNEAASARVGAKEKAAQEAREQLLGQIAEALGMKEAPPDPAALASQLETTQADAVAAVMELDVYRAAIDSGANPVKLLDSVAFRQAVDALEADGFDDGLKALIAARVEADPSLRLGGAPAAPTSRQPVAALRPGALPGAAPEPSLEDQIAEAQKAGDYRAVIRLNGLKMQAALQKK